MRILKSLAIIIVLIASVSCQKVETLPARPRIEYRSFEIFDTTDILGNDAKGGRLKFYFEDGDGNMGLAEPDGILSDTSNLFFTLYRKQNGEMVLAPPNDPLRPSSYRIPYMFRLGQNKILKGTISVTFFYLFYSPADTIRYDFHIKDRADNISNIESTSDIIISVNNIY
jgi:hypothetical protein